MLETRTPIRVVIIEDSQPMTDLLASILRAAGDIQVVGTAADGENGVRLVKRLHPDLVTMDIYMPKMNGVEAVRAIMRDHPVPIIIVSTNNEAEVMGMTFQALRAGALTVLGKPGLNDPETSQKLIQTVRVMAGVPVIHHWGTISGKSPTEPRKPIPSTNVNKKIQELKSRIRVIGIAASTGGPSAVATVLRNLPADFPLPIVLVQHFSPGFASSLVEWLGTQTGLRIRLATHGASLQPGTVLLAPDEYHLQINRAGTVELTREPAYKGLRPSANPLFNSLALAYGPSALGILLTGMGDDGVDGLIKLHETGGVTIAQEKNSCVVYGMPREAIDRGAVDGILTPEQIGFTLSRINNFSSKRKGGSDG
jgi:two-component system, chemotaxis family, protein-glutamate methylesterase/glutaminase